MYKMIIFLLAFIKRCDVSKLTRKRVFCSRTFRLAITRETKQKTRFRAFARQRFNLPMDIANIVHTSERQ